MDDDMQRHISRKCGGRKKRAWMCPRLPVPCRNGVRKLTARANGGVENQIPSTIIIVHSSTVNRVRVISFHKPGRPAHANQHLSEKP